MPRKKVEPVTAEPAIIQNVAAESLTPEILSVAENAPLLLESDNHEESTAADETASATDVVLLEPLEENMIADTTSGELEAAEADIEAESSLVEDHLPPQQVVDETLKVPSTASIEGNIAEEVPPKAPRRGSSKKADGATVPHEKKPALPKAPTSSTQSASRSVLTVTAKEAVETAADRSDIAWHEVQNAARTHRILTGVLGGIERMESGGVIAVVYYKDMRVVIPISEMMITLSSGGDYGSADERQSKLLNNMISAEIDFVVRGTDAKSRSAVASRKEAMLRKRRIFYQQPDASGQPQIRPGRVVQARVVAVATKVVRAEIFGVETSIFARDLSWEWVGDAHERFSVGDKILVKILEVNGDSPETLMVKADAKSVTKNTVLENLARCKVQGKYAGTVTDVHKGVVYVRLAIGVNAVAHSCNDSRLPAKGDSVSFAVTRKDADHGVAVGLITRIIRQMI